MTATKICGITSVDDAVAAVDAGADAIGVNFWSGSRRFCPPETARSIVRAVGDRVEVVAVFVDAGAEEVRRVREEMGLRWVQLHGDEPPDVVRALLPDAYKALRVAGAGAVAEARRYPGERLLLDACVPGEKGGTGHTFDWDIAAAVARERRLTLAGGLSPDNVAGAVRRVRPERVDVASGVESAPGRKDPRKVRAFVEAVRRADAEAQGERHA